MKIGWLVLSVFLTTAAWGADAPVQPKSEATITFTKEEAQTLMELLDMATKSYGIKVAAAVAHFVDKIDVAFRPDSPKPPDAPKSDKP